MRSTIDAGHVVRRVWENKMRTVHAAVAADRTDKSAEVAVQTIGTIAGRCGCGRRSRMEMAAVIRVPLQLHGAGRRSQAGRGKIVQELRTRSQHKGLPAAEGRECSDESLFPHRFTRAIL